MSRRPLFLLALGALCTAAAAAVWLAAFAVPGGRELDAAALRSFAGIARTPLQPSIDGVAVLADPLPFMLGGALLAGVALLRRRLLMAAVVPVVLVGASACTQLLKPALADLRIIDAGAVSHVYPGSWPSGHATAAMSLALCLVLVAGPRLRPLAALVGAGYAIGVGYALVALGWHLPTDVLGGYLVAASFALLGAAALAALETRRPVPEGSRIRRPAAIPWAGLAASAAALALLRDHPHLATAAARHVETLLVASVIGLLGVALTGGLALALRRE